MLFRLSYIPFSERQLTLCTGLPGIEPGSTVLETDVLFLYTTGLFIQAISITARLVIPTGVTSRLVRVRSGIRRLHPGFLIHLKYQPIHENDVARNARVSRARDEPTRRFPGYSRFSKPLLCHLVRGARGACGRGARAYLVGLRPQKVRQVGHDPTTSRLRGGPSANPVTDG